MFDRHRSKKNKHHNDNNEQRDIRPALDWREVEKLKRGSTVGTVNKAERPDGSYIYSWCMGKEGRGQREGQVLKFCDPRDIQDAHDVLDDIDDWIDEDRAK